MKAGWDRRLNGVVRLYTAPTLIVQTAARFGAQYVQAICSSQLRPSAVPTAAVASNALMFISQVHRTTNCRWAPLSQPSGTVNYSAAPDGPLERHCHPSESFL